MPKADPLCRTERHKFEKDGGIACGLCVRMAEARHDERAKLLGKARAIPHADWCCSKGCHRNHVGYFQCDLSCNCEVGEFTRAVFEGLDEWMTKGGFPPKAWREADLIKIG